MDFEVDRLSKIRRQDLLIRNSEELRENMEFMANKYIGYRAQYSVNIASQTRHEILDSVRDWEGQGLGGSFKLIAEFPISIDTPPEGAVPDDFPSSDPSLDAHISGEYKMVLKYVKVLDKALREVMELLMQDSWPRFCRTEDYKTLQRCNAPKPAKRTTLIHGKMPDLSRLHSWSKSSIRCKDTL